MLRFVAFAALISLATAYSGYGMGGYGGLGGYSGGGYGSYGGGGGSYGGVITGAVQSQRSVSFYDVPSTYSNAAPLTIDLPSGVQPLNFIMRTRSSPINVQTYHEPGQGSYQETSSVDPAHVRVHTVTRPIIQRLNEIITPYRQIRQEVRPVQESVEQVVARGTSNYGYGNSGYGNSYGGDYGGSSYGSPLTSAYYKK